MNIVNEKVEHNMFGFGVVTEINENKIWVQFKEDIGTKIFLYPDAFNKFLKAMNPIMENNIMQECYRKQEQINLELERMAKEREDAEAERKAELDLLKKKPAARKTKKKLEN